MKYEICRGNYKKLGIGQEGNVITFSAENIHQKTCSLVLYPKNGQKAVRIPMIAGDTCTKISSVGLLNFEPDEYDYNFELDGKVQLDSYARKISGREIWADPERSDKLIKCSFDLNEFPWKNDCLPGIKKQDLVIYKLHMRGFSMAMPGNALDKGTVSAVERKIPYLKEMGITSLEFMPIYEFEEFFALDQSQKESFPPDKLNYWGYTKGNYFAPKSSYLGKSGDSAKLKRLILKLHENQMECILEFYFDKKCNPNFILEVLRYWAREYHVDGFHLISSQEAAVLVARDVYLGGRKLFFESFPDELTQEAVSFMELYAYNEAFSYGTRKMINQQGPDLYEFADQMKRQHHRLGFVNFVTGNNGFTLSDLFSYTQKCNLANGEDNQDGNNWNISSNCGQEGVSRKKPVLELRNRQIKNALAVVFLAQGVPLLWMGDENGNSQQGNNNAYCQDNEIGWKNWSGSQGSRGIYDFLKQLADIRKKYGILHSPYPMGMSDPDGIGYPDLSYHGERGWQYDLGGDGSCIGVMYCGKNQDKSIKLKEDYIYLGYNFSKVQKKLALPSLPSGRHWNMVMDTGADEIFEDKPLMQKENKTFSIKPRSVCVLVGKEGGKKLG